MSAAAVAPGPDFSIAPRLVGVTATFYIIVLSVYCTRIYTRLWPVRTLGLDDLAISLALVSEEQLPTSITISNTIINFAHSSNGVPPCSSPSRPRPSQLLRFSCRPNRSFQIPLQQPATLGMVDPHDKNQHGPHVPPNQTDNQLAKIPLWHDRSSNRNSDRCQLCPIPTMPSSRRSLGSQDTECEVLAGERSTSKHLY
jgi:hypothetical protein